MDAPILYTRLQAAKLLNVHPNTISNLVASGKLRCHRLTYRVFFTRDDLQTFIDSMPKDRAPSPHAEHAAAL